MPEQQELHWLTFEQAAERLQTTARTVGHLVKQGRLPALYLSANEGYRVRVQDVDALATVQVEDEGEEKAEA